VRIPDMSVSVISGFSSPKTAKIFFNSSQVSGSGSFTDPEECAKNISDNEVFLDVGKIIGNGESTIVEINEKKIQIHREGSISKEEILNLF